MTMGFARRVVETETLEVRAWPKGEDPEGGLFSAEQRARELRRAIARMGAELARAEQDLADAERDAERQRDIIAAGPPLVADIIGEARQAIALASTLPDDRRALAAAIIDAEGALGRAVDVTQRTGDAAGTAEARHLQSRLELLRR